MLKFVYISMFYYAIFLLTAYHFDEIQLTRSLTTFTESLSQNTECLLLG